MRMFTNGELGLSTALPMDDGMGLALPVFELPGVRTYSQSLQVLTGESDGDFNVKFT